MDILLTFVLPAVLFLALEILWCRPAWPPSAAHRDHGWQQGSAPLLPVGDPFELSFVQRRLDVLAAELDGLEDDPDVFAKAFRIHVVKAAYAALLADAARLTEVRDTVAASGLPDVTIVEIEMASAQAGRRGALREELDA